MEKEYKPILVFYFQEFHTEEDFKYISSEIEKIKERTGYENVISVQGCLEPRVEIISVDKATVVEDIQKYIDYKFENKNVDGNIKITIPNVPIDELLRK